MLKNEIFYPFPYFSKIRNANPNQCCFYDKNAIAMIARGFLKNKRNGQSAGNQIMLTKSYFSSY